MNDNTSELEANEFKPGESPSPAEATKEGADITAVGGSAEMSAFEGNESTVDGTGQPAPQKNRETAPVSVMRIKRNESPTQPVDEQNFEESTVGDPNMEETVADSAEQQTRDAED